MIKNMKKIFEHIGAFLAVILMGSVTACNIQEINDPGDVGLGIKVFFPGGFGGGFGSGFGSGGGSSGGFGGFGGGGSSGGGAVRDKGRYQHPGWSDLALRIQRECGDCA